MNYEEAWQKGLTDVFEKLSKIGSIENHLWNMVGNTEIIKEMSKEAVNDFCRKSIDGTSAPNAKADVCYIWGYYYDMHYGDSEKGMKLCLKALESNGEHAESLEFLGHSYRNHREYDQAEAMFSKLLCFRASNGSNDDYVSVLRWLKEMENLKKEEK